MTEPACQAPFSPAPELRVQIHVDRFVQFSGTAAQLVAEGVIPPGFAWPPGTAVKYWRVGNLRFYLWRARPEGHKGRKDTWLTVDHWCVRWDVVGRAGSRWAAERMIERTAEKRRKARAAWSPAGQRQLEADFDRLWRARTDRDYQAFKARILGPASPAPSAAKKGTSHV